jgi:hypothetical protein
LTAPVSDAGDQPAATFAFVRALTHWIRDGHGPSGGGMSVGGRHFHHYNLGIALLAGIGAVALRGKEEHRHHPLTAASYGVANALIVDEAALLIDLQAGWRWPGPRCGRPPPANYARTAAGPDGSGTPNGSTNRPGRAAPATRRGRRASAC